MQSKGVEPRDVFSVKSRHPKFAKGKSLIFAWNLGTTPFFLLFSTTTTTN